MYVVTGRTFMYIQVCSFNRQWTKVFGWFKFSLYISYNIIFQQKNYPEVNSCPILIMFFINKSRIKCNFTI